MLELGGGGSVLTQTTRLGCTVDLTQRVQRLALSMLQQVCLALRGGGERERQRDRERDKERDRERDRERERDGGAMICTMEQ